MVKVWILELTLYCLAELYAGLSDCEWHQGATKNKQAVNRILQVMTGYSYFKVFRGLLQAPCFLCDTLVGSLHTLRYEEGPETALAGCGSSGTCYVLHALSYFHHSSENN